MKECFETKNTRDLIKLHGDIEEGNIVITKSDYEDFALNHKMFVRRLEQDLLTKSLFFIGYSYNDENIQSVVNNVRQMIGAGEPRQQHHMVLKKSRKGNEGKLVAHIIDMDKFNDYSADFEIAKQRRHLCTTDTFKRGCARCGKFCPLNLL